MAAGLHISISAERLFSVGELDITNSIFTSLIVSLILILFAILVRTKLKKISKPAGIQNFAEMLIEGLHGLVHGVTGDLKKTRLFFPFISTFFLVILLNNWLGLLPGVGTIRLLVDENPAAKETGDSKAIENIEKNTHLENEIKIEDEKIVDDHAAEIDGHEINTTENIQAEEANNDHGEVTLEESATANHGPKAVPIFRPGTADLNTTLAFAIISIFITQIIGVKYLKLAYFKKFINFSSPILFFVGILEIVSEFAKIISFAFRLFGNIFAGEVLLVVMAFLLPLVVPMPFYGLELFVGFIQALVFAMLSLVFFNMATLGHEDH